MKRILQFTTVVVFFKHQNGFNSVSFAGNELKVGVVVAEGQILTTNRLYKLFWLQVCLLLGSQSFVHFHSY